MGASMTGSGYGMAVYDSGVAGSFAADGQFYEYQPGYRYGSRVVVCGITLAPSYMCACVAVWLCGCGRPATMPNPGSPPSLGLVLTTCKRLKRCAVCGCVTAVAPVC